MNAKPEIHLENDLTSLTSLDTRISTLTSTYLPSSSADKAFFFNFFYENNDIFEMIHARDEQFLQDHQLNTNQKTFIWASTGFAATIFGDKVVKKYAFPNVKTKKYKKTAWMSKYIGVPMISFFACKLYFCKDRDRAFNYMSEKYSFTFDDYNRAMNILDRAQSVGKLDELLNKGSAFDWSSVPGGKPSM